MHPEQIVWVLFNADMKTSAGQGEDIVQAGIKFLSGWPHNFQKKIPGLFQDFSRKIIIFSRIISKDRKLSFEHKKWRCTINYEQTNLHYVHPSNQNAIIKAIHKHSCTCGMSIVIEEQMLKTNMNYKVKKKIKVKFIH